MCMYNLWYIAENFVQHSFRVCIYKFRPYLDSIPKEIKDKFYGCGTPIPFGIEGKSILDLGSGSGRDCYIASKLVGENGSVTGIDMTEEQLSGKYFSSRLTMDNSC